MREKNTCFGVYAFSEEKRIFFRNFIKSIIESHTGLAFIDATDYFLSDDIKMSLIREMIYSSQLIVADIDSINPNVFIEIGIAYELRKKLIIICHNKNFKDINHKGKIPFDLGGREIILYDSNDELTRKLGQSIVDSLFITRIKPIHWEIETGKDIVSNSPSEIQFNAKGLVNSSENISSYFSISYHLSLGEIVDSAEKTDHDIRFLISKDKTFKNYIAFIFPWEYSQSGSGTYDSFINYYDPQPEYNGDPNGKTIILIKISGDVPPSSPKEFDVFISLKWPSLVVESAFYGDQIRRIYIPLTKLLEYNIPLHINNFIGFRSCNSKAKISNILVKEIQS
jgi:hypothetical protein